MQLRQTSASLVVAVEAMLQPMLPQHATTRPYPHLDAFVAGAIQHNPGVRSSATLIKEMIDAAPVDLPHVDWTAFRVTATKARSALDQVFKVPEALSTRMNQLNLETTTLEIELKAMHDLVSQPELEPALHALRAGLESFAAPSTTYLPAPENPPVNLAAAIDQLASFQKADDERSNLLRRSNSRIKLRLLVLIDALEHVSQVGSNRVKMLRSRVKCQPGDEALTSRSSPNDWTKLCQAHMKLSQTDQNGLDKVAQWRAPSDLKQHAWYLAFVHEEAESLVKQLQDMTDWQAQTVSVLAECRGLADNFAKRNQKAEAAHQELSDIEGEIQGMMQGSNAPRSTFEQKLKHLEMKRTKLQQKLKRWALVDHVAELASLLKRHFPALLVLLHPEQSAFGVRLREVLGPDIPGGLIVEIMAEVDQTLTRSSLGQLELFYSRNHNVHQANVALFDMPQQQLAVKEYVLARQDREQHCHAFLRELRAMRKLQHPYIIPVLGAFMDVHSKIQSAPSAYLIQPWCAQGDLQQWLSKHRLLVTTEVLAGLMLQLRTALAFMHSKGLVHRDVKLSNVMLDGSEDHPRVRLGDFDIAKAVAESTYLPFATCATAGTVGYIAPEVLFGRGRVGARPAQDAFSFGCVLYNAYMFPQTVPPAVLPTDELVEKCNWDSKTETAGNMICKFPHLASEMCDSTSKLYQETRALLSTDSKQRPSLLNIEFVINQSSTADVGPAVEVLQNAPELISEVGNLLMQLSENERGPRNMTVNRVERVHNPVLWERYRNKRREMVNRTAHYEHFAQLLTATVDALPGQPALLRDMPCQERLLLHGLHADRTLRDKIVRLGLDYRFAGSSSGTRFGHGVYQTDHPGKSHQYTYPPDANGERTLIITRVLLGHAFVHRSPNPKASAPPLLPQAPNNERYDSVIATPPGEFSEVIVFDNDQIYPELVVYYTIA